MCLEVVWAHLAYLSGCYYTKWIKLVVVGTVFLGLLRKQVDNRGSKGQPEISSRKNYHLFHKVLLSLPGNLDGLKCHTKN